MNELYMNKYNKKLFLASYFNIGVGIIYLLFGKATISILIFALSLIIVSFSKDMGFDLINDKKMLIILSIIDLPICFISSIFLFSYISKLSDYEKQVNGIKAPPKKNKNTIFLIVGIGLVIISGIILATTSWNYISNYYKVLILGSFAIIFYILSLIIEKKLSRISYLYWILSVIFFTLVIISMFYFNLFNNYLNYSNSNKYLSYTITYFTISIFSLISYLKYKREYLFNFTYFSIFIGLTYILKYFKLDISIILLILSSIIFLLNIFFSKDNKFNFINTLCSYLLVSYLFKQVISHEELTNLESIFYISSSIINALNLLNFFKSNSKFINIFNLLLSYLLILLSININETPLVNLIIVLLLVSFSFIINSNSIGKNDDFKKANQIVITILLITFSIESFILVDDYDNFNLNTLYNILIPIIFLIYNSLSYRGLCKLKKIDNLKILNPFVIFLLETGIFKITSTIFNFRYTIIYTLSLLTFIYCILINIKSNKNTYRIACLITLVMSLYANYIEANTLIGALLILPSYYLYKDSIKTDNKTYKVITNILLLFSLYLPISMDLPSMLIISRILGYILILCIIILFCDDELLKKLSYFLFIVPFIGILNYKELDPNISILIPSIIILYITFLLNKFIIKQVNLKKIIIIFGVLLAIEVISSIIPSTISLVYISLISLILTLFGYFNDNYTAIFNFGVLLMVINIIIELRDIWGVIPIWLYLLIMGLIIIIIYTFMQARDSK